jgi:hypothetical protein
VVASPAVDRVTEYVCPLATPRVGALVDGAAVAGGDELTAAVVAVVFADVLVEPPHAVSPTAKAATKTAPRRLRVPMCDIVSGGQLVRRVDHDCAWRATPLNVQH